MQKIKVSELKEHSMNTFYFDNMMGEKWKEFLKSVETSGVIEPIIVNQEKTIISGHQRFRACLELGIEEVLCDIRIYDNKQQELKDLIETNIRQRGDISSSSLKMARIIKTLEECYGIQHGGARINKGSKLDNVQLGKSQKDIAEEMGMSQSTYLKTKKLLELIPELQDLFEEGKISASVGSRILARLSQEEQRKVLEDLGVEGLSGKTQAQLKEYVSKLQDKEKENEQLKRALEKEKKKPKEKEIIIEEDIASKEELKIVQRDKIKLLQELERLRKEVFESKKQQPMIQEDTKKTKELEDKIKKLEGDLRFKDEILEDKERLIKNKDNLLKDKEDLLKSKEKIEQAYKEGYDKYNDIINATCDYQSTDNSFGKRIGDGVDTVNFVINVENLLKNELAPLKYERFLRDVNGNEVVKENINKLINMVREWTDEIDNMININKEECVSNYSTMNNFVDGIIIE